MGLDIYDHTGIDNFLAENPDRIDKVQEAVEDNSENNSNFADNIDNDYGTDRRTEENQYFPRILGEYREGEEASRTLAAAASLARGVRRDAEREEGFPTEKFLAQL